MSRMTRRVLIRTTSAATGVAAFGILTRRGGAAEFTWRYANEMVPTHSMNVHLQQAAERIRRDSGGRMEVQIFPNNQLGGATDMLSQLRTGVIQLLNLSGVILSTVVPVASINGIGFAFKEYDNVWAAMDGALGAHVRGAIEKAGLLALDKMWTTATARSPAPPIRSTRLMISRASRSGCRSVRCGLRCSGDSVQQR
jgi:TRAP-type C4-dicarboxylate transport system substrate-binding protein